MYPSRGKGSRSCDEFMPVESASIVVRKVPLNVTKEQMEQLFLKAGAIKYVYFPKVPRHFTTKYCFIKYHDIRRAREAQQLFNGYKLGDQWLQVVAYDPTYKFRHSLNSQNLNSAFDDSASGRSRNSSTVNATAPSSPPSGAGSSGAVPRQAGALAYSPILTRPSSPSVPAPIRFARQQPTWPNSKPSFLEHPPRFVNTANLDLNGSSESDEPNDDSDDGEFGECRVVDNILLDSEVGFWTWLDQKLHAVGPLHYTTNSIDNVLSKLPGSARKQFSWRLGAFRLRDKERFQMIGPFLCLPDQVTDAKEKCLALCCNWRAPCCDIWEPVSPSEIRTSKQLIQYLRKMLMRYGPLTVDDIKIRQLLQSLSTETSARTEFKLPMDSTSGLIEFLESPNAKKIFSITGSVIYLTQEHGHIFGTITTERKMGADRRSGLVARTSADRNE